MHWKIQSSILVKTMLQTVILFDIFSQNHNRDVELLLIIFLCISIFPIEKSLSSCANKQHTAEKYDTPECSAKKKLEKSENDEKTTNISSKFLLFAKLLIFFKIMVHVLLKQANLETQQSAALKRSLKSLKMTRRRQISLVSFIFLRNYSFFFK